MAPVENSTSKPGYELVEIDSNHLKATAFDMLFVVWRRETSEAAFARSRGIAEQLAQRAKTKVGVVQIVETTAIPPDAGTRRAISEYLKSGQVAHSSVIHDGSGFKAATVRAIVNLQLLAAKPQFKHLVFGSVDEAAVWHASMQERLGRSERPAALATVITALRALHRERYP